ncbi:hypothetical protein ACFV0B_11410 [Streptomyces xanthophaeus]|uniref:hypothetical protein n=1 Tax=Streptomyces xanthophaeus TaxID=67385 RepID=UPI003673F0E2
MTTILRPEDYGATLGIRDSTTAFRSLMFDVNSRLRADNGGGVPVSTVTVELSGMYTVSGSIMQPAAGRAQGLTFRGIGKRASEIVMTGAEPLFVNADRWMGVRFYDMSFRSTNPKASFLYSSSTGACQDWGWTNCEWRGTWERGIGLDGPVTSNTNSEMFWTNCHVNGSYNDAFLRIGMTPSTPQQDQFLNYWFDGCKIEYDSGDFIRADKGGFISVNGGSFIIKGQRVDGGTSRFFHMPTAGHYDSVQHLNVRGVRFELRSPKSKVIESKWAGHIVFDGCSDTALGFQPHSPTLIAHEYTNPGGVTYRDCDLVGKHAYHLSAPSSRQRVIYQACTRKNNRTASSFLALDGARSASAPPIIHLYDGDGIV